MNGTCYCVRAEVTTLTYTGRNTVYCFFAHPSSKGNSPDINVLKSCGFVYANLF